MLIRLLVFHVCFLLASASASASAADTGSLRATTITTLNEDREVIATTRISYNGRGLRSHDEMTVSGPSGTRLQVSIDYLYDDLDQLIQMTTTAPLYGFDRIERWVYTYNYNTSIPPKLTDIRGLNDEGFIVLKTFAYDSVGRVIEMSAETTAPDGGTGVEQHKLRYDGNGLIVSAEHTATAGEDIMNGSSSARYNIDGALSSYTRDDFTGVKIEGQINREPSTTTRVVTLNRADAETFIFEVVTKFESGPCRVPAMSDGLLIDWIFNSIENMYPAGTCKN